MKYNSKYSYFSIKPDSLATGVTKKLHNSVKSLNSLGYESVLVLFESSIMGMIKFVTELLKCDSLNIIIRFSGIHRTIILFPFVCVKRFCGHKVIIDIPTPLVVAKNEIKFTNHYFIAYLKISILYIFYPYVLVPYTRIIQSAYEGRYFLWLLNYKTVFVGNGIDTSTIQFTNNSFPFNCNKIKLIAVAQLEIWHGYDRILHGLEKYLKRGTSSYIGLEIVIVGDGNERKKLMQLAQDLSLTKYIRFTGDLQGEELDKEFINSNIAISSLGSYRVNLLSSSPLKSREYCARGIPFVTSDFDPDFPTGIPFVFSVPNDSSPLNFDTIFEWYEMLRKSEFDSTQIRAFAEKYLDYKFKVKKMFLF